ncbi:MAG: glutamate--tRNA ligase, partial [Bacteroidales bacterium]|nr:glutamate--tRNA ligase [Bacteroidales bacterium]
QTRVRFAPSPTGPLHMGGVRTALYNYLFAKQNKGKFILRIEDTDSQRFVPGAEEYILESLAWCGIVPDEGIEVVESGNTENIPANKKITYRIASEKSEKNPHAPYRQSERKPLYRQYAEQLVENGYAYYAFDSAEELSKLRAEAEAKKQTFIYNYQSRKTLKNSLTLPADEVKKLIETTDTWTIRFKIPEGQTVKMNDLIRGDMEVETNTLDDKVLWKAADQLPTYHLANIVDDHLMEITEVIRGAEWLPSLPLHYLLYKAFGWEDTMPRFAHLSLLLKPDGKGKLSKRDGDRLGFPVFPLKWTNPETGEISRGYREDGYYPEAFVNLLALLGWNPGTEQELFTLEELVPVFSLERVIKSGAKFNVDKAKWFNEQYLRRRTPEQLAREFRPMLSDALNNLGNTTALNNLGNTTALNNLGNTTTAANFSDKYLAEVCELIKERAHFANEFWDISKALFASPSTLNPEKPYDENDVKKFCTPDNLSHAQELCNLIAENDIPSFTDNAEKEATALSQAENATAIQQAENATTNQQAERVTYKQLCCEKIEELLTGYIKAKEWKMGQVMNTLRLFFTGNTRGLGISDIIYFIGKEETLRRIRKGLSEEATAQTA